MATASAAALLRLQLREGWLNARRALDGLTDAEYEWEPVSPCWSVRRRADVERGWGRGEFCCEDAWPPPDPLPTTTIAWRVIHLAAWTDVYRGFAFAGQQPDLMDFEIPGDMEGGVDWLIRAQDAFIDRVDGLDDDEVFMPRPTHWGQPTPVARIVSGLVTEHVHHLAEVSLLRDLRRGHAASPPAAPDLAADLGTPLPTWWAGS